MIVRVIVISEEIAVIAVMSGEPYTDTEAYRRRG